MHFIHSTHQFKEPQLLRFLSPQYADDICRIDIESQNGGAIVLQTPWLCCERIAQTKNEAAHAPYMTLSVKMAEGETSESELAWRSFTTHAEEAVREWLAKKKMVVQAGSWHGIVSDDGKASMRFFITNMHGVYSPHVFDANRQQSSIDDMVQLADENGGGRYLRIRLLLHLSHIWCNMRNRHAGIRWQILQIQHHRMLPPSRPMFDADTPVEVCSHSCQASTRRAASQTPSAVAASHTEGGGASAAAHAQQQPRKSHPVFGEYFSMVSMGVPLPAAQQKMIMAGLDPAVLEIPIGMPLPDVQGGAHAPDKEDIASSLLGGQTNLKKTEGPVKSSAKSRTGGKGHGISLNDIVAGLRSLRRTWFSGGGGGSSREDPNQTDTLKLSAHVPPTELSATADKNAMLLELFKSRQAV